MRTPRSHSLPLAALVLALSALAGATPALAPLTLPSGKVLQAEVMVNDEDRAMGLMFRPSLPLDRGMIFIFETADFHSIWMKNCKFPIDILWLDEAKKVVHVAESVPPCKADPCPVYSPMRRAWYVIELNAGQAGREGAVVGATVRFDVPPGVAEPSGGGSPSR